MGYLLDDEEPISPRSHYAPASENFGNYDQWLTTPPVEEAPSPSLRLYEPTPELTLEEIAERAEKHRELLKELWDEYERQGAVEAFLGKELVNQ